MKNTRSRTTGVAAPWLLYGCLMVVGMVGVCSIAAAQERPGAVYVMTNQASGNSIAAFARGSNGGLTARGTFSTGGTGFGSAGDPLGSQGALAISSDGHFLYAVNAGSNDVSVMATTPSGLVLVGKTPSGGAEPISLTLHKDLLYVLNAGGTPNISGFSLRRDGSLVSLQGSQQPLAGGSSAGPAGIAFSPNGRFLAVTEKGTSLIDTYAVLSTGLTSGPISNTSNGTTPFGLAFSPFGRLIVSEAAGGATGAGAASSYAVSTTGNLALISGSIADTQTAPCWVAITSDGRLAFTTNTGSDSVSAYSLSADGTLVLLNGVAGSAATGGAPIDMALSNYDRFLYVLTSAAGTVTAFKVGADGNLVSFPGATGIPVTAQGIVAQ